RIPALLNPVPKRLVDLPLGQFLSAAQQRDAEEAGGVAKRIAFTGELTLQSRIAFMRELPNHLGRACLEFFLSTDVFLIRRPLPDNRLHRATCKWRQICSAPKLIQPIFPTPMRSTRPPHAITARGRAGFRRR